MGSRTQAILGIVLLVVAYAVGYYMAPEKVKTEIKTVEVEKKTEKTDTEANRDKHKEMTTKEITHADGTKETDTTVIEDTRTAKSSTTDKTDDTTKSTDKTKEVTKSTSHLTLSPLAGVDVTNPTKIIYGGHVTKDVLGPVNIGVWGMSNKTAGLSIGVTF